MFYNFPTIKRIEDVLPAVEGRDEFVVAERDGFTVVNYNVGFEDTFTIDENDMMANYGRAIPKGEMRRELRGLIFYPDGRLMSRPFHKFFNIGEREETQMHNIDLSKAHTIVEKMDGSMIRPMYVNGAWRLGTKMGITDTSEAAEKYAWTRPNWAEESVWIERIVRAGLTPIFEFVSPKNRIVIEYAEADLVLLAIRDNKTGNYLAPQNAVLASITQVPTYGSVEGTLEEYIARQRSKEGREGDILRVGNMMYKIKNDWYVRIHKVKDKIRTDRHVLALLLENELDDVYPHLSENDYNRVKDYERDFHCAMKRKIMGMSAQVSEILSAVDLGDRYDKKRLAVEVLPASRLRKDEYDIVFKVADGHDVGDLVMARVRKGLGNTVKYNTLAEWLGLTADKGEEE